MKGMIKGSNYSDTSSNVSVLLHLLFMRKKREGGREEKERIGRGEGNEANAG